MRKEKVIEKHWRAHSAHIQCSKLLSAQHKRSGQSSNSSKIHYAVRKQRRLWKPWEVYTR